MDIRSTPEICQIRGHRLTPLPPPPHTSTVTYYYIYIYPALGSELYGNSNMRCSILHLPCLTALTRSWLSTTSIRGSAPETSLLPFSPRKPTFQPRLICKCRRRPFQIASCAGALGLVGERLEHVVCLPRLSRAGTRSKRDGKATSLHRSSFVYRIVR